MVWIGHRPMIMTPMPVAAILPESIGPYVSLMIIGFAIGILGHLTARDG